jgi:hypothetical protein
VLLRALLIAAYAAIGCSSGTPSQPDGGAARDATIADSTIGADAIVDAPIDAGDALDATHACGGACDPTASLACSDGMRCTFAHGVTACVSATDAGVAHAGDPCSTEDACGGGLACFATATTGTGSCAAVCCPMASACDPSMRCRGDGTLVDGQATAWGRCLPPIACDLAHPDHACATREGCYIVDSMGHTECLVAGTVPPAGACAGPADCVPGYVCAGLTSRSCAQICFLASTAPHQGCADLMHCQAQAYSPSGTGICVPN